MDRHRLAEERSIAYHRVIAERLATDPSVIRIARARVQRWLASAGAVPAYARAWDAVLALPRAELQAFLVDPGEKARELRQSTPFAGALAPRERWRIWREVGERARGAA